MILGVRVRIESLSTDIIQFYANLCCSDISFRLLAFFLVYFKLLSEGDLLCLLTVVFELSKRYLHRDSCWMLFVVREKLLHLLWPSYISVGVVLTEAYLLL